MAKTEEGHKVQIRFLQVGGQLTLADRWTVWDIEQSLTLKDEMRLVYNVIRWPGGQLELDYVYEGRLYRVNIDNSGQYAAWLYPANYPIPSAQLNVGADRRIEMDL